MYSIDIGEAGSKILYTRELEAGKQAFISKGGYYPLVSTTSITKAGTKSKDIIKDLTSNIQRGGTTYINIEAGTSKYLSPNVRLIKTPAQKGIDIFKQGDVGIQFLAFRSPTELYTGTQTVNIAASTISKAVSNKVITPLVKSPTTLKAIEKITASTIPPITASFKPQQVKEQSFNIPKISPIKLEVSYKSEQKEVQINKPVQVTTSILKTGSSSITKTRQVTYPIQIQPPVLREGQKLIQPTKQAFIQQTKLSQQQIYSGLSRQGFNYNKPQVEEPKIPFAFKLPKLSPEQQSFAGNYPVFIRRFGKFKQIGLGRTPTEAINLGRKATKTTLARSFKIPGLKATRVSGYRTKVSKKSGVVFIQPSKSSLSNIGEKAEIQIFKKLKGGLRRR